MSTANKKVGVFGGTFDPVHLGHLIMAEQCREQAKLEEVWFVPAARPPHKPDRVASPFRQRVEMLQLAVAGYPVFRIDELEEERPGPSYMVHTLDVLAERHSAVELHLIVGSDCLPDLPTWREPGRLVERAGLLVVGRPAWPLWPVEQLRKALRLPDAVPFRYQTIHTPQIEISSRDLRRRRAEGHSIRYLVPRAVECYIETHGLYRPA